MTYQETLDYLFNAMPMYQRVGAQAFKADLVNISKLCNHLGNPQNRFKSIHVGGTNGKGSTSHALASILQEAGYKTGLYTSPHLKSFTERIKINGGEVSEGYVVSFVERNKTFLEEVQPSFFEMTVAMAFQYFAEEQVDFAVVEVGMGGRLDSTNIIVPELSLITNIGFDHVQFLGDTRAKIAWEKAGIIKENIPVVISETHPETRPVFETIAKEKNAPVYFGNDRFQIDLVDNPSDDRFLVFEVIDNNSACFQVKMDLTGAYQVHNLVGILQAITILRESGLPIEQVDVMRGLEEITRNTGLKGRWQKLGESPLVICDTGHNVEAVRIIFSQIKKIKYKNLYIVWGMSNDKDTGLVLDLLPKEAYYFFTEAKLPRAMPTEELRKKASNFGLRGEAVPDVNQALDYARDRAGANDFIFVGGSTFVVAELDGL